jgi:hypothetical protein
VFGALLPLLKGGQRTLSRFFGQREPTFGDIVVADEDGGRNRTLTM